MFIKYNICNVCRLEKKKAVSFFGAGRLLRRPRYLPTPNPKPDPRQIDQRDPEQTRQHPHLPPNATRPIQSPNCRHSRSQAQNKRPCRPQINRETSSTQMIFEFVHGGCQLGLSREAVPCLGTTKGTGFCPCAVFFLGILTSVFVFAEVAGRTYTIFIEGFTKVFWGRVLQRLESYNL